MSPPLSICCLTKWSISPPWNWKRMHAQLSALCGISIIPWCISMRMSSETDLGCVSRQGFFSRKHWKRTCRALATEGNQSYLCCKCWSPFAFFADGSVHRIGWDFVNISEASVFRQSDLKLQLLELPTFPDEDETNNPHSNDMNVTWTLLQDFMKFTKKSSFFHLCCESFPANQSHRKSGATSRPWIVHKVHIYHKWQTAGF